ncbi:RHS repeat-associated core domain-containing protein [Arthrobacter pascens]|uniref:RHS repeat-associated core domain-containing protein n=1 Tax=Arthrobacter pascens TaxID=1677 RepID=UPI00196B3708|nr:RHS repeat-associated core domain-containing protein [Arthrobacter pascens]MBN3496576.1 STAS domain-containing protein [Arthrobacter pascens]
MQFDVEPTSYDGAVIRVSGQLNMVAAPRFRELVAQIVGNEGRTLIVVDLAGADFLDSTGLGALVSGLKIARLAGGDRDDATGYTKFGARYDAPLLGRFNQADPSGQEANRYLYAGANPINFADPTGYSFLGEAVSFGIQGVVVGVFLGAVCAATLGGCTLLGAVAVAAVAGGIGGLTGKAVGARIDGGNNQQVADAALQGGITGAISGAARGATDFYLDKIAGLNFGR